jgi:RNA polymerase sigma-70 factor (ECF subfamily)
VRLAFIAALQLLPPRQRAVLILRDVLDWRAKETAELLDMSIGAANSALYRARNRLAGSRARLQSQELRQFPIDPATLDRYTRAWERADVESLTSLLVEEAAFAMPPFPLWFQGRESIGQAMKNLVFQDGPGEYRLVPAGANLQPAFGLYRRENDSRRYAAGGLQILEFVGTQIRSMTVYLDPIWNAFFGLPTHLPDGEPSLPSPG